MLGELPEQVPVDGRAGLRGIDADPRRFVGRQRPCCSEAIDNDGARKRLQRLQHDSPFDSTARGPYPLRFYYSNGLSLSESVNIKTYIETTVLLDNGYRTARALGLRNLGS